MKKIPAGAGICLDKDLICEPCRYNKVLELVLLEEFLEGRFFADVEPVRPVLQVVGFCGWPYVAADTRTPVAAKNFFKSSLQLQSLDKFDPILGPFIFETSAASRIAADVTAEEAAIRQGIAAVASEFGISHGGPEDSRDHRIAIGEHGCAILSGLGPCTSFASFFNG